MMLLTKNEVTMAKRERQYTMKLTDLEFNTALGVQKKIATEAAKIIVESGIYDFERAKKKSAHRLGVKNKRYFPDNLHIQQEIVHFQNLFKGNKQHQLIQELRKVALQAMLLFEDFQPHLVGAVLQGCAAEYSPVEIHVFADTPETVDIFLTNKRIPFSISQIRMQLCNNTHETFLCYHLHYKETPVEVTVFPMPVHRTPPRDNITQNAIERASLSRLMQLL